MKSYSGEYLYLKISIPLVYRIAANDIHDVINKECINNIMNNFNSDNLSSFCICIGNLLFKANIFDITYEDGSSEDLRKFMYHNTRYMKQSKNFNIINLKMILRIKCHDKSVDKALEDISDALYKYKKLYSDRDYGMMKLILPNADSQNGYVKNLYTLSPKIVRVESDNISEIYYTNQKYYINFISTYDISNREITMINVEKGEER